MIKNSISYKLSTYISLAVISVFILFILTTFVYNRRILHENFENQAIGLGAEVNSMVNNQLVSTKEITTNIANQAIYYAQNNDLELLVTGVMQRYEYLYAVHVNIDSSVPATYHNFLIMRYQDSLSFEAGESKIVGCEQEKNVIAAVSETKKGGWTEPFYCDDYDNFFVSYYMPIIRTTATHDTFIVGEVICELSLVYINQIINDLEAGNGYTFIIDKSGRYVTHPNKELILNRNISDLSNSVYNIENIDYPNIFNNEVSGSTIAYPEILDHKKSWVYYTPIDANDWYLIFVLPYKELFSGLYFITLRLFIFALIGIVAIYLLVTYIANRLVRPLRNVTDQLNKFSSQTGVLSKNEHNEIKIVSESLKSLKLWYQKQKEERNQALIKDSLQKQDLLQASEIQQSIIKTEFPAFPDRKEIDIHAVYKPAREVSGDLFDFFFITDDDLVFTIGDVSGKGIPAAIFMSIAQTIIKSNALYKKAKTIVNKANAELCTNNQHQFFLTLFLGVLKIKKRELYFCNAAHTTALVLKADGSVLELNQSHGLPLGLYPEKEYVDSKIPLDKNDTIILYTDGITELQNQQKEQFGTKRLKKILQPLAGETSSEIAAQVEIKLKEFQGDTPQYDDISLLILKYKA